MVAVIISNSKLHGIAKSHTQTHILKAILHAFYENCDTPFHTTPYLKFDTLFYERRVLAGQAQEKVRGRERELKMAMTVALYFYCWNMNEKNMNWRARAEYDFLLIKYAL